MSEPARPADDTRIRPASWLIPPAVHLLLLILLMARLILAGPSYERTFHNFQLLLPALTMTVLAVARWFANYWYIVVLWLPVAYALDAAITLMLGGWSRRAGWIWFLLFVVVLLGLWAVCEYSWLMPMWKLYQGLSR